MPYCAKCGIEVDNTIKKCPLCNFQIPKIDGLDNIEPNRFPPAVNVYPEKVKAIKYNTFLVIAIVLLSSILITFLIDVSLTHKITWSKYSMVGIASGLIYIFLSFGFIRNLKKVYIGIILNTLTLISLIALFSDGFYWFFPIALPITVSLFIIISLIYKISEKSKRRGANIAGYVLFGISIYCYIIEMCISKYIFHRLTITWSLIVTLLLTPLGCIFMYFHYGLPQKYKDLLKKKFHL